MPLSGCVAGSSDGHPTGKALSTFRLPGTRTTALGREQVWPRDLLLQQTLGSSTGANRGVSARPQRVSWHTWPEPQVLAPAAPFLKQRPPTYATPHLRGRTLRCSAGNWCGLTRPSLCVSQAVCMLSSLSARLLWWLSGSVMHFSASSAGILSAQNRTGCIYLGALFVPCGSPGKQTPVLWRQAAVALAHHCGAH